MFHLHTIQQWQEIFMRKLQNSQWHSNSSRIAYLCKVQSAPIHQTKWKGFSLLSFLLPSPTKPEPGPSLVLGSTIMFLWKLVRLWPVTLSSVCLTHSGMIASRTISITVIIIISSTDDWLTSFLTFHDTRTTYMPTIFVLLPSSHPPLCCPVITLSNLAHGTMYIIIIMCLCLLFRFLLNAIFILEKKCFLLDSRPTFFPDDRKIWMDGL